MVSVRQLDKYVKHPCIKIKFKTGIFIGLHICKLKLFIFFSFGFIHIGRVGSVAVTVSIATERYINVCYPTTHFSRKYLFLITPILFAFIYNAPKFFEIVACTQEEKYQMMLKEYTDEYIIIYVDVGDCNGKISYKIKIKLLSIS